jgi:hypothetical protein
LAVAIMLPATTAQAEKLSKMPREAQDAVSAMTKALAPMSNISLKHLSESANFSYDKPTKSWTARIWEYNLFLMEVQVKKPKGKGTKKAYNVAVHLDRRTIKPKSEPWSKIAGVGVINPIFTYGKQTRTIKIAALPPKLRAAAKQLHPRGFPMVTGLQLTAGVNPSSTKGTMLGDAFARIDKAEAGRSGPKKTPLYVLRTGVEKAAKAKKGRKGGKFKKAKKNNAFIELTRRGTWPQPLDMPQTQLTNATFYFDKDQTFGFWGTLVLIKRPAPAQKFVRPNYVAMAYKGPVSPKVTKAQLESIQIGFGAPEMTLETFGRLMIASGYMQSAGLTAIAPQIRRIQGPAASTIISGMQVLPLDALKVTNPAWGKQRFPSANFNGRYVDAALYNVLFLGPSAKDAPKGVTPPAVHLSGTMNVLGKKIARTSTVFDRRGLNTSSSAGIKIPLGKLGGMNLGNPGVTANYTVAVTRQQQAIAMGGKMSLPGKFGSVNFGYAITNAGGYFTTPATCAFPFEISSTLPASLFKPQVAGGRVRPAALDSSNPLAALGGTFKLSVPDTVGNMASCAADLFYMVVDGALVAFNKAGEVAKVAVGAAVDGAQEVAAFGGAAARIGAGKLLPGGKAAYRAAQKNGGRIAGYAKYTAIESSKSVGNVFGGGAKAFGQFAKNPNQSFKRGLKTFNKGWKLAKNPRKLAGKAAKKTKRTGKKVLKTLKKLDPTKW